MSTALEELTGRVEAQRRLPSPEARRHIRLAAGASLADVAVPIGVSKQSVFLWERGHGPSPKNVVAYLRVLEALKAAS